MYDVLLIAHSLLRWVVLITAVAALGQAVVGLASGGAFAKRHKLSNLAFMIGFDVQFLLGVVLYAGLSPMMSSIFSDFGGAMKDGGLRFWAVEHVTGMVLALVFVHLGYALAKRAKSDKKKHLWGTIFFGLTLLATVASIPWPFREAIARPLFRLMM